MRQKLRMRLWANEIDDLVEDLLADPSLAEELKREYRQRLRLVERAVRDAAERRAVTKEPEELFENVPV